MFAAFGGICNMEFLEECMNLCGRQMTVKDICTNTCCSMCDVPYLYLEKLPAENEQLKQFIKELTSRDGKIWLSGGYVYDVKKVLKDGDVE